ncbi:hypothetical protein Q4586_09720 [Tenacibaculum soleae]|nr:hypothetical protein [Tenacibaculum soleae]
MNKHVREFTKEIHWRKFIYVFEEAMKFIPNSHNNTFDFQKIQYIKYEKNPLEYIGSFNSRDKYLIYFKIWIYQLGTALIEYNHNG